MKRKKKKMLIIFLIIIVLLAIIYAYETGKFKTLIDNLQSLNMSDINNMNKLKSSNIQNELLSTCTKKFNDCMAVGRAKGNSISLLKKGYFNNSQEANVFYRTWAGFQQAYTLDSEVELSKTFFGGNFRYPVVLFAIKSKPEGSIASNSIVVICQGDGNLVTITSGWACG